MSEYTDNQAREASDRLPATRLEKAGRTTNTTKSGCIGTFWAAALWIVVMLGGGFAFYMYSQIQANNNSGAVEEYENTSPKELILP